MESLSTLFPTDNLYKFLSITGLVILGFCFVYPDIKLAEIQQKVIAIQKDEKILNYELRENNQELKDLSSEQENLTKSQELQLYILKKQNRDLENELGINLSDTALMFETLNKTSRNIELLKDRNEREYFEFLKKHDDDLHPLQSEVKRLDQLAKEVFKKERDTEIKNIKIKFIKSQTRLELDRINTINIYAFIGQVSGLLISVFGFIFWYRLYQKPQDEIMKYQLEEYNRKFKENEPKRIITNS